MFDGCLMAKQWGKALSSLCHQSQGSDYEYQSQPLQVLSFLFKLLVPTLRDTKIHSFFKFSCPLFLHHEKMLLTMEFKSDNLLTSIGHPVPKQCKFLLIFQEYCTIWKCKEQSWTKTRRTINLQKLQSVTIG